MVVTNVRRFVAVVTGLARAARHRFRRRKKWRRTDGRARPDNPVPRVVARKRDVESWVGVGTRMSGGDLSDVPIGGRKQTTSFPGSIYGNGIC